MPANGIRHVRIDEQELYEPRQNGRSTSPRAANRTSLTGRTFAYRRKWRTLGEPVQPVKVIQDGPPGSNQVRILHLGGDYEGMKEWVSRTRLVVPWDQASQFVADEHHLLAAFKASGDVHDTLPFQAASTVFDAIAGVFGPQQVILCGWAGPKRQLFTIQSFDTSVETLKLDRDELLSEAYAYVDRHGDYWAPFPLAERLAKRFCVRFPMEVLADIQEGEDKLRYKIVDAYEPHRRSFAEEWLEKRKPVFEMVRKWCGSAVAQEFDEIQLLRQEVCRLRKLAESLADWLRGAGHPVKAGLVLKELKAIGTHVEYEGN